MPNDILDIDFLFRLRILYNQTNTRRWCNGSAILVTKATHASANGLLHHLQRPDAPFVHGGQRIEVFRRA